MTTFKVEVPVPVLMVAGVNDAEAPAGCPYTLIVTGPLNPLVGTAGDAAGTLIFSVTGFFTMKYSVLGTTAPGREAHDSDSGSCGGSQVRGRNRDS
jgi:hypothetical protein